MKKHTTQQYVYAIVLCIMAGLKGFSQDAQALIPNITPPSPESSKFTEYGKNSANEYTGKLNTSIPIYEYVAGKLKMPITLSYSGAGVKVQDMAPWTGINWNLSVGGVINRQIKDGSDEGSNRVIVNEQHLKTNASDLCAPDSQYYWGMAVNNEFFDTEADVFSYNFMGYSGSFYLDVNKNPVYIENENEVKIQILGNYGSNAQNLIQSKTFLITTPDGGKYYFGGNVTESTMSLTGDHATLSSDGVTSFFLYKAEHPIHGTILLEYDTLASKTQSMSKSHTMTTSLSMFGGSVNTNHISVPPFIENISNLRIIDPKRLKKIKSPDSKIEVVFNRTDYMTNKNFTSVLNTIAIVNIDNIPTILKKVNFVYDAKLTPLGVTDFVNASRFFLIKVEIDKDLDVTGSKHEEYVFEYDDPFALPSRMSNRRDALGYFNNRNNASLLPMDDAYIYNQTQNFANLDPSFTYSKKGTLKKITYPTKGYSVFEYEPLQAKKEIWTTYTFEINSYDENVFETPNIMVIPGTNTSSIGSNYTNFPTIFKDYTVQFSLNYTLAEHSGGSNAMTGKGVEFIIRDLGTLEETTFTRVFPQGPAIHSFTFKAGHNYSLTFRFKDGYVSTDYRMLEGYVSFKIFEGYEAIEGLGIRLKKDVNYNFDGVQTNYKRYYYGSIDGRYNDIESFPVFLYSPKKTYSSGGASDVGSGYSSVLLNVTLTSEAMYPGNQDLDPEKYPRVSISYGGDSFENGGVEKNFLDISDVSSNTRRVQVVNDGCFYSPRHGYYICGGPLDGPFSSNINIIRDNWRTFDKTNHSYYNGKLLSERVYVNKNNSLFKVREQQSHYTYYEDTAKKITNFVGCVILSDTALANTCPETGQNYNSLSSCYFGYYSTKVFSFNLEKTITTEYIDPVPMSDYVKIYDNYSLLFLGEISQGMSEEIILNQDIVETPYKKIITKQDYEYGTLRGLPTKITTTSSEGVVNSTVNTYVNQASGLSVTPLQGNAYAALLAQNNVASPVQVQQYNGTPPTLVSTQRTIYKQAGSLVLPELVQTAKSTQNLEDRVVFDEYDVKGNPTLMSLKSGMKTKYLYNTRNQVIAKIENFTGTLDANTTTISGDPCAFINQYPNAVVTLFTYDPVTYLLTETLDSNCRKTTYVYDALQRLKQIKDHDGNVVKEFDTNYKPQ